MKAESFFTKRWAVFLFATLCCLLWGSATPSIKTAYVLFQIGSSDVTSRVLLAGVRFIGAGILIILYGSISAKRFIYPQKSNLLNVMKLGMVQTVLQYFTFFTGLAHTTGVKSAILNASATFFAILFSVLFRTEKMTAKKLAGCIIGFAGCVLINLNGSGFGRLNLLGDGAIIISSITNGLAAVMIKRYSQKEDPVVLTGYQFLFGGIILTVIGLCGGGQLQAVSGTAWILLAYMAAISAVAYTLWSVLLKYNPVSGVTIYNFMNPLFGVLLSALILKETNAFTPLQCILSLLLISLGIIIVNARIGKKT